MSEPKKRYPNSAILGRNDRQDKEDPRSPPYTGQGEIDCPKCKAAVEFWIKAYVNETRDQRKYFKMNLKSKDAASGPKPPVVQTQARPAPAAAPAPAPKPHMEPTPATDEDFRY